MRPTSDGTGHGHAEDREGRSIPEQVGGGDHRPDRGQELDEEVADRVVVIRPVAGQQFRCLLDRDEERERDHQEDRRSEADVRPVDRQAVDAAQEDGGDQRHVEARARARWPAGPAAP